MFAKTTIILIAAAATIGVAVPMFPASPFGEATVTLTQARKYYDTATPEQKEAFDAVARGTVVGAFAGWITESSRPDYWGTEDNGVIICFAKVRNMTGDELLRIAEYVNRKVTPLDDQDWRVVIGVAAYVGCVVSSRTNAEPSSSKPKRWLKT